MLAEGFLDPQGSEPLVQVVVLVHEKAALHVAGIWGSVDVGISVARGNFRDSVEVGAFLLAVARPEPRAHIHLHPVVQGAVEAGGQDMDGDPQILCVAPGFPLPVMDVDILEEGCLGNILIPSEAEVAVRFHAPVSHEYKRAVLVGKIQVVHKQICRFEQTFSVRKSL